MLKLLVFFSFLCSSLCIACDDDSSRTQLDISVRPDPSCSGLFGLPNERSGVSTDQCNTSCLCTSEDRTFTRPSLDSTLFDYIHTNPLELLEQDPYQMSIGQTEIVDPSIELACVIDVDHSNQQYRLDTVSLYKAKSANITHLGTCGACSSLQDLKVYLERIDLTEPVRSCGLAGLSGGINTATQCLIELGFSPACAEIWGYNTIHTRENCLQVCLSHLGSDYLTSDGELNECLACDETLSGPIFKQIAGRTRRNSGLASAICRPCSSVSLVFHSYLGFEE